MLSDRKLCANQICRSIHILACKNSISLVLIIKQFPYQSIYNFILQLSIFQYLRKEVLMICGGDTNYRGKKYTVLYSFLTILGIVLLMDTKNQDILLAVPDSVVVRKTIWVPFFNSTLLHCEEQFQSISRITYFC